MYQFENATLVSRSVLNLFDNEANTDGLQIDMRVG